MAERIEFRLDPVSSWSSIPNCCEWMMPRSLALIRKCARSILLSCGLATINFASAQTAPVAELHTAEQVRSLSPAEAAQQIPVRLRGVLTFFDEPFYSRFIQDSTAGIYLMPITNVPPLKAGDEVEVEGFTRPGDYAPVVLPTTMKRIGKGTMPPAKPVSLEELVSGREDSQFVEVTGIVRAVRIEEDPRQYLIDVVTGGERFTAYARQLPVGEIEELPDSIVRIRGVCGTLFNRQRQLFGFRLLVPRLEDLIIEKRASDNPFDVPMQSLSSLLRFTPQGTYGHRVKVSGTVIYQESGTALFIEDDKQGLYCQTRQRLLMKPGDRAEVLGFLAKGEYTPVLQDAVFRNAGTAAPPEPDKVDLNQALSGTHDCRLVQIEAKLLERTQRGREQSLVLERDGFIFHGYLGHDSNAAGFAPLQNGSRVAVTGVCVIEPGSGWHAGEGWRAKSFRILLRSPADVLVLSAPPWWTLKKVLWIAFGLSLLTVAAFSWIAVLGRRVQKQTGIIRQQLQVEAALKERYQDLFENATDMVFTHDLSTRITSINKAGERLLQRNRNEILSAKLPDLLAEDQRMAARQWLEQVVAGIDMPTAEWDFLNVAGQRVKLEISSRLIEQNGGDIEVESVARDITERRRLEREILEISNREQRRIGHDLHDGVCQQLAAITYLVDILGDRLEQKHAPEFSEAQRIGHLINETNAEARSVARGLFPVRLEEHGLFRALEDLAETVSSRYRVTCRFVCQARLTKVDSQVELHLYYIAQEALLNAISHGKATSVIITLIAEAEHFKLCIQDNGMGFDTAGKGRSGMGIRIMRYRAQVIGGTLDLQSQSNQGTQVICFFDPTSRESVRITNNV